DSVSSALYSVFLYRHADHRDLHSFPTRRSSDLWGKREGLFGTQALSFRRRIGRAPDAVLLVGGKRRGNPGRKPLPLFRCRFRTRSEEHTSELQSRENLVCRLLLEKKNNNS